MYLLTLLEIKAMMPLCSCANGLTQSIAKCIFTGDFILQQRKQIEFLGCTKSRKTGRGFWNTDLDLKQIRVYLNVLNMKTHYIES